MLALDRFDSKKHKGIISEFQRRYVKNGIFPKEISKMIGKAFIVRNESDYDDMFLVSKSASEEQIKNAEYILENVKEYVEAHVDICRQDREEMENRSL